jgi:hypothetical protein
MALSDRPLQGSNLPNSALLRIDRNERAVCAHFKARGNVAAEKATPGLLIGLEARRAGRSENSAKLSGMVGGLWAAQLIPDGLRRSAREGHRSD